MAYAKHTWVDPKGSNLNRFTMKQNGTSQDVELIYKPDINNSPTPFSTEWMNEIEDGIANADTAATAAKTSADSALTTAQTAKTTADTAKSTADNALETAQEALETAQAGGGGGSSGSGGSSIPPGTSGYLATHSGIEGTFGTPKNPADFATATAVNAKQDKIAAGTSGHLATHSGTQGAFGTAVNPADLTAVRTTAPTAAYSGTGSRLVYLASEPSAKYDGWIYLIAR
jgi:hypothetical protein